MRCTLHTAQTSATTSCERLLFARIALLVEPSPRCAALEGRCTGERAAAALCQLPELNPVWRSCSPCRLPGGPAARRAIPLTRTQGQEGGRLRMRRCSRLQSPPPLAARCAPRAASVPPVADPTCGLVVLPARPPPGIQAPWKLPGPAMAQCLAAPASCAHPAARSPPTRSHPPTGAGGWGPALPQTSGQLAPPASIH